MESALGRVQVPSRVMHFKPNRKGQMKLKGGCKPGRAEGQRVGKKEVPSGRDALG